MSDRQENGLQGSSLRRMTAGNDSTIEVIPGIQEVRAVDAAKFNCSREISCDRVIVRLNFDGYMTQFFVLTKYSPVVFWSLWPAGRN